MTAHSSGSCRWRCRSGCWTRSCPRIPSAAKPIAQEARAALAVALEELRELSQGIHPAVLTERGLAAALEELVGPSGAARVPRGRDRRAAVPAR